MHIYCLVLNFSIANMCLNGELYSPFWGTHMKRPLLIISLLALPAIAAFSFSRPAVAYAEPVEESQEEAEPDSSEPIESYEESEEPEQSSETSEIVSSEEENENSESAEEPAPQENANDEPKIDLKEIEKYIEDIKNRQFLGTTVGAIVASAVSILLSLGFSLLNRHNILQTRTLTDTTRGYVGDVNDLAVNVKKDYNQIKEELKANKEEMLEIKNELKAQIKDNAELKKTIEEERANFQEEKKLLLTIIGSNRELVANGKAEEILRKYGL